MPTSNKEFKDEMLKWYNALKPSEVIDIGIGEGTYSDLFRSSHESIWLGIEAWAPYVREYKLDGKYNKVIIGDFRYIDFDTITDEPDLIIIGDCLEHLTKDDALYQLTRLQSVAKNIFISVPHGHCPQGSVKGNWFEKHRSTWDHEELKTALLRYGKIIEERKGEVLSVFWWQK